MIGRSVEQRTGRVRLGAKPEVAQPCQGVAILHRQPHPVLEIVAHRQRVVARPDDGEAGLTETPQLVELAYVVGPTDHGDARTTADRALGSLDERDVVQAELTIDRRGPHSGAGGRTPCGDPGWPGVLQGGGAAHETACPMWTNLT